MTFHQMTFQCDNAPERALHLTGEEEMSFYLVQIESSFIFQMEFPCIPIKAYFKMTDKWCHS